jgi:hypothetical protein
MALKYKGGKSEPPRRGARHEEEKRLPYNPFPLATLRATGLSRRAKHIFGIFGAHTGYEGFTLVGFKRLVEESGGCKEYVSKAIAELLVKGRITKKPRGRKLKKSDRTFVWCLVEELLPVGVTLEDIDTYPHVASGWTVEKLADAHAPEDESLGDEQTNASPAERTDNKNVCSIPQDVGSICRNVSSILPNVSLSGRQEPSASEPLVVEPLASSLPAENRHGSYEPEKTNSKVKSNPNTCAQEPTLIPATPPKTLSQLLAGE